MRIIELLFLAVGLSMDAFAAAICAGLETPKTTVKKALTVGLYFGVFQAIMPLIGFFGAKIFSDRITKYDHWIAFALLVFLGVKMMTAGRNKNAGRTEKECAEKIGCGRARSDGRNIEKNVSSLHPTKMLPLALATSIDALAVGVSFAFLQVHIASAASFIGGVTFIVSAAGVKIGNAFGSRFHAGAAYMGGAILVLTGCRILYEHIGI